MSKKKLWYDDYLNKNQANIVDSLEKDAPKFEKEDLEGLLEYESDNDKRMKVIEKIKQMLKSKVTTKTDIEEKRTKKMSKEKEKKFNVLWTHERIRGRTLPTEFDGVTLHDNRPVELNQEQLDYVEENYEKDSFRVLSDKDMEEEALRKIIFENLKNKVFLDNSDARKNKKMVMIDVPDAIGV